MRIIASLMKFFAYGLILLTLVLTIQAVDQLISGRARLALFKQSPRQIGADRATHPEKFKNLMTYQWIRAVMPGTAGFFLLYLIRRNDRLDPLSPRFQGVKAIDDLPTELESTGKLKRENKSRFNGDEE
jgi:hypothetical protein